MTLAQRSAALALAALAAAGCKINHVPAPAVPYPTAPASMPATTQASDTVKETLVTGGGRLFPDATPARLLDVTQRVFPAVVRIDVAAEVYQDGKRTLQRGIGSGVIFDQEGHILTNYHVAGRAVEINITLANKERVPGKLVGDDHWTDLAVVQMDMDAVKKRGFDFKHASLGDSSTLVPGQDVIAIGTPFGLARTMTLGIVSNNERTFYPDREDIDGYETGLFNNWIQMDTPIAPGNSGGPLVDLDGYVVGINTRGVRGQALNFAIPANTAKEVVAEILKTASQGSKGYVKRADLGIDLKPMQDLNDFYNIDINKGVLVNNVDKNSAAAKAGVKVQDIILSINDVPTNVRFPEEIAPTRKRISELPLDKPIPIKVQRGSEQLTLTTTPLRLESAIGDEKEIGAWGLSVRDVTRALANDRQLDDDKGVIVTSTTRGKPADKAELENGDVIRRVGADAVDDLASFNALFEKSKDAKQVLLQVQRGRGVVTKVLKLD